MIIHILRVLIKYSKNEKIHHVRAGRYDLLYHRNVTGGE